MEEVTFELGLFFFRFNINLLIGNSMHFYITNI